MSLIITIGRQFGSGGRELGKRLAETLGIGYFDREVISEIAKQSGMAEGYIDSFVENPVQYYPITFGRTFTSQIPVQQDTEVYRAQSDAIRALAGRGDCVIIGRCADYALADFPNVVTVFICADEDVKLKTLQERYQVTESKAKDIMIKTDKKRASYYNYYSSKHWGDCKSYDLCINSSKVGMDGAIRIIRAFAEEKQAYAKK